MTATQVSQAQILKCTGLHERACLLAFGWFVLNQKSFALESWIEPSCQYNVDTKSLYIK